MSDVVASALIAASAAVVSGLGAGIITAWVNARTNRSAAEARRDDHREAHETWHRERVNAG